MVRIENFYTFISEQFRFVCWLLKSIHVIELKIPRIRGSMNLMMFDFFSSRNECVKLWRKCIILSHANVQKSVNIMFFNKLFVHQKCWSCLKSVKSVKKPYQLIPNIYIFFLKFVMHQHYAFIKHKMQFGFPIDP